MKNLIKIVLWWPYWLSLSSLSLQAALRQITDKAREFGAGPLFNQILPLLMSPTLEDQERHLLVKVIDRILYKLDDLVRPYVHKVCQCKKTVVFCFYLWKELNILVGFPPFSSSPDPGSY